MAHQPEPRHVRIDDRDRRYIWEFVPDTPDTCAAALAVEAAHLWDDLDRALRNEGSDYGRWPWTVGACSTAGRIIRSEQARGHATPWREVSCHLLAYGIYQHLVEAAGIPHDPVNMTAVHNLWDEIHRGVPDPPPWPGPGGFRLAP